LTGLGALITMLRMTRAPRLWRVAWPFLAACAALLAFWSVGSENMDGFVLDLGSIGFPTPRYALFAAFWFLFGGLAAVFLALGLVRASEGNDAVATLRAFALGISDGRWIGYASALALLIPAMVRFAILRGAPLTDDENCYRFSSELLASGRLYALSHPVKLFFDHTFMINDGHYYSKYPMGWPALMVPGTLLGISGYMNALYSALTVPALFLIVRRLRGAVWARVAVTLYVFSPFVLFCASTEMSHTSCGMALAWTMWSALRSRDERSPLWSHALVAFFFGLAFSIRPSSGIGIGLPLLAYWAAGLRSDNGRGRLPRVAAMALPGAVMAGLFLLVNQVQNGSPFYLSYQRLLEYAKENGYRFSDLHPDLFSGVMNFIFDDFIWSVSNTAIALFRLNLDLFGWPLSFLFVFFAGWRDRAWLPWACLACFLAAHFFISDSGIDSFGPVHYYETALPIIVLTVMGLSRLTERLGALAADGGPRFSLAARLPMALAIALVVADLCGFFQVRARALIRIADDINTPFEAVAAANPKDAVIFIRRPFSVQCVSAPTRHFVYWIPLNDPDMKNDVLWANHITVEDDRRLMTYFPDRKGFLLLWRRDCKLEMIPIEKADPNVVPKGLIGGSEVGPFAGPG
jgi:hypothetical protein